MTPIARSFSYRPEIDGLRAIAVLAVIAGHFSREVLPAGYLGVDVFFVISGFVITGSLSANAGAPARELLLNFYVRRIKRLMPALIACVLITAVVASLVIDAATAEYKTIIMSGAWSIFGAENIYAYSKSADYFATSAELNPFTHMWSLGVEEQFYLLYPTLFLIMLAGARRNQAALYLAGFAGLVVASMVSFFWLLGSAPSAAYFLTPMRFWELGLGCLTYFYCASPARAGLVQRASFAWSAAVVLGLCFWMPLELQGPATFMAVASSAVLIASLRRGQMLYAALSWGPVVAIGLISYSLYLWHWSVLSIARWTVGVSLHTAPGLLVLMFALAAGSYLLIERPLRRKQWSRNGLRTLGYGVCASTVAFACLLALRFPLRNELYTGQRPELAAANKNLMAQRDGNGKLLWRAQRCVLSSNDEVGKTIVLDTCLLGEKAARAPQDRLFLVIGDSSAAAQRDLVAGLREAKLGAVALTSTWGATPVAQIPNTSAWSQANDYYWASVVPALMTSLKPGDVVVMMFDLTFLTPQRASAASVAQLSALAKGLETLATDLEARGVSIIFQTSGPYMRDARCTPAMAQRQWFNWGEPKVCNYFTRAQTLARRKPLADVLAGIERAHPNFYVLDLMPVLCPGPQCRMQRGSTFLYRDYWAHVSIEAAQAARPLLTEVAKRVIGRQQQAQR